MSERPRDGGAKQDWQRCKVTCPALRGPRRHNGGEARAGCASPRAPHHPKASRGAHITGRGAYTTRVRRGRRPTDLGSPLGLARRHVTPYHYYVIG
eukprot:6746976-Prymnesium_polylepis.1